MNKDLRLALAAVRKTGVHAELGAHAEAIYEKLDATDARSKDFSIVYQTIAERSGLANR
jgi:3-hydroxyisobutyrate dehydrogenase-like beta-hydroxyacid dehydrogenase